MVNKFASLYQRFLAQLLDSLLIGFAALIPTYANFSISPSSFTDLMIIICYFTLFEGLVGKTPGKKAANIEVVNKDGDKPGILRSTVRNLLRPIDFLPTCYLLGIGSIYVSDKNKRLGDLAAGTEIINSSFKSKEVI
jgi:uncharacterized RDD family membrane protein YckC